MSNWWLAGERGCSYVVAERDQCAGPRSEADNSAVQCQDVAPRLRTFAASAVWWLLSIGMLVWPSGSSPRRLQLINTVILPPPHAFVAELRNQAQFLMPQVGAEAVGSHFIALRRHLGESAAGLDRAACWPSLCGNLGSLAFYSMFGKLTLPDGDLARADCLGRLDPVGHLRLRDRATGPQFSWCSSASFSP